MAVKAEDCSDSEEESGALHDDVEEQLRQLQSRISSSSYPLREEAVALLHPALLALHSHFSMLPRSLPSSDLLLLLHELQSLKSLIPPNSEGVEGSTSCVISSALNYLEQLSRLIQSMKEGMQEFTNLRRDYSKDELSPIKDLSFCNLDHKEKIVVDNLNDDKLHILVHCERRVGLLSRLILAFDTLGLVIDQMDISNDDVFQMDVITTQVTQKVISNGMIKRTLSKILCEGNQKASIM